MSLLKGYLIQDIIEEVRDVCMLSSFDGVLMLGRLLNKCEAKPPKKTGGRRPKESPKGFWKMCLFLVFLNALTVCAAYSDQLPWEEPTQYIKWFGYFS